MSTIGGIYCSACQGDDIRKRSYDASARIMLEVMRRALEAGQLDQLEFLLKLPSSERLRASEGGPDLVVEIERYWQLLAEGRAEESRRGGRGSLIDPDHSTSRLLQRHFTG